MKDSATITMATPVLERLRAVAKTEKRTLSQQIELIVEKHFTGRRATPRRSSSRRKEVV